MAALDVRWLSIFADIPAARFDVACSFWAAVTGTTPGQPAGERREFQPLQPPDGDCWLWLQCIDRGEPGWHVDLHVADPEADGAVARQLGATPQWRIADAEVFRSPGGLPFCLAAEHPGRRRRRSTAPGAAGNRSLADQLCLDIPADRFEGEADFWSALTGWPRLRHTADQPVFDRLAVPPAMPAQLLLQRLTPGATDPIHAHLDLSVDDRGAEVDRHRKLGAELVRRTDGWTTMRDPAGAVYCVTGRRTGRRIS